MAVLPARSLLMTSTLPSMISTRHAAAWPFCAAKYSGVCALKLTRYTAALPMRMSSRHTSVCPASAAPSNGVQPSPSR